MIKRFLIRLIQRYKLHDELNRLLLEDEFNRCNRQVTNAGSIFYQESKVYNHKNDKGKIRLGYNTHIRGNLLVFKYGGEIQIGNDCYIGENSNIWSGERITIGNGVLISHNVNIVDTNSHELDSYKRVERYKEVVSIGHWNNKGSIITAPIIIKDFAWISFNAIILKGVTIGEGAVVAAGSVVTKDVPDYTLVAGNPAVFVKKTT